MARVLIQVHLVERNNEFLLQISRTTLLLLVGLLPLSLLGQTDPVQKKFESGVQNMIVGEYFTAIKIFEAIYIKNPTPRVKLEWARAAFLNKDFDLSKKLFLEVLVENPPVVVQFNIRLYLEQIEAATSTFNYGFTFVRDTNPFFATEKQTILLFGLPFVYQPETPPQTLSGLRFYFTKTGNFNAAPNLRWSAYLDDTEYEGNNNNKTTMRLGLEVKQHPKDNMSISFGQDLYAQHRGLILSQPYVSFDYKRELLSSWVDQYQISLRRAENKYEVVNYLDGPVTALTIAGSKKMTDYLQVGGHVYLDQTRTSRKTENFDTSGRGLFGSIYAPSWRSHFRLAYSTSTKSFEEPDTFFGERKDSRENFSIKWMPENIKLLSMVPELEVGIEKTNSTRVISGYERSYVNATLKHRF